MRGSTIAALVWLTIVPVAALAASKQEELHGRGTGYLKKRFVGGQFRVIYVLDPTTSALVKGGPGSEILEIDAPEALAFEPSREILYGQGLICTNAGTCKIPGCHCCIVCYCGLVGGTCDTDDTGFYSRFERLAGAHEVELR